MSANFVPSDVTDWRPRATGLPVPDLTNMSEKDIVKLNLDEMDLPSADGDTIDKLLKAGAVKSMRNSFEASYFIVSFIARLFWEKKARYNPAEHNGVSWGKHLVTYAPASVNLSRQ